MGRPHDTRASTIAFGVLALVAAAVPAPNPPPTRSAAAEAAEAAPVPLVVREGLRSPESVLYDPSSDVYLVSNIDGPATARDDNGFISRIAPDGSIETLRWIDGSRPDVTLHAPKGMAFAGDVLLVADIDTVRRFDRASGAPLESWPIPGAVFLNDVAVDAAGRTYVSDTAPPQPGDGRPQGIAAIYRLAEDGAPEVVAQGETLHGPNGLAPALDGTLLVATFGADEVYALTSSGARRQVARLPMGRLDGLVRLDDGTLLVSSWAGEAIYRVAPDGHVTTLATDLRSPANFDVDTRRRRIVVPLLQAGELRILPLADAGGPQDARGSHPAAGR